MKFVIIGLGQFGRALALELADHGYEVSVLDARQSVVDEIADRVSMARSGDACDAQVLRQLELVGDDIYVVVAIGEGFERSILIVAQLREMGVKNLYCRCSNDLHNNVLRLIGVHERFRVEDVAAKQLADRFIYGGLERLRRIDGTHSLADVKLPDSWVGKHLREVDLRSRFHLNMLTLRRGKAGEDVPGDDVMAQPEQPVIGTPDPSLVFEAGDILVLFGKNEDLQNFVEQYQL